MNSTAALGCSSLDFAFATKRAIGRPRRPLVAPGRRLQTFVPDQKCLSSDSPKKGRKFWTCANFRGRTIFGAFVFLTKTLKAAGRKDDPLFSNPVLQPITFSRLYAILARKLRDYPLGIKSTAARIWTFVPSNFITSDFRPFAVNPFPIPSTEFIN